MTKAGRGMPSNKTLGDRNATLARNETLVITQPQNREQRRLWNKGERRGQIIHTDPAAVAALKTPKSRPIDEPLLDADEVDDEFVEQILRETAGAPPDPPDDPLNKRVIERLRREDGGFATPEAKS